MLTDKDFPNIDNEVILGIDLGTMNSHVAVFRDGRVQIIPHAAGDRYLSSTVAFHDALGVLVGMENAGVSAAHTVSGVKRLIGRKYSQVLRELPFLSYQVWHLHSCWSSTFCLGCRFQRRSKHQN